MNFVAAVIAIVAFSIMTILGWDAGLTLGAFRALGIGLIALACAVVLPANVPWTRA